MLTTVITEPGAGFVTLADIKAHLKILHANEDTELEALLATAHSYAESYTNSALRQKTLEGALPGFPLSGVIHLTWAPLFSVTSVKYVDTSGVLQTMDSSQYQIIKRGPVARIERPAGVSWPETAPKSEAVLVTWVAGYAPDAEALTNARHAIKLLTGHWYFSREATDERGRTEEAPHSVARLLDRYRQTGWI
ncbi:MAG: phage head-tail connector protein [Hyphomicrobiaceae bacterium]